MIRPATGGDVLPIVDMIERLRAAVDGPIPVGRAHTAAVVASLIADPDALVLVSGAGFIAGRMTPTIINPAPIAQELGWWAADGSGLRLLRAFERWAADRGALLVQLSTGADGPELSRLGYSRAEQAWVRSL